MGAEPVRLPHYGAVLLASGELPGGGVPPGDTALWYAADGDKDGRPLSAHA